jgi:molybdate transport system substrate-binding protein
MKRILGWLLVCGMVSQNRPVQAARVTVFAAASLADSLQEIAAAYEKQTADSMVFNFAASGVLARQIEAGAPADLFCSTDEARMDALEKQGLIVKGTLRNRLSNLLVIVTAADSAMVIASPKDLLAPGGKRLALGEVGTVPAGSYAKAHLTSQGLWSGVEGKIVPCENVRAVLATVASGNVDAGIVYRTDAATSRRVKVACEVPREAGPEIRYPMALVSGSRQPAAARSFLAHLEGEAAARVFKRHGFLIPAAAE